MNSEPLPSRPLRPRDGPPHSIRMRYFPAANLECIQAQFACHDPRLSRFLGQQRLEPRQPGVPRERSVAESVPLAFLHMLATLRERRA